MAYSIALESKSRAMLRVKNIIW